MGIWNTDMQIKMWTLEAQIMRLWRNKDTCRDWIHVHECYINGKEMGCILPVSFSEAELKINELICLVE